MAGPRLRAGEAAERREQRVQRSAVPRLRVCVSCFVTGAGAGRTGS